MKTNIQTNTIAFYTFGCKVNQYDTQQLRGLFKSAGWREVGKQNGAGVYLINTCTVTGNSDRKARQLIRSIARNHPESKIVVTGCYAESRPEELENLPNVTLVAGNKQKGQLVELLTGKKDIPASDFLSTNNTLAITEFAGHTRAFVKIQDGCDECCSYCIVPQVRGKPSSRLKDEIFHEIEKLADLGYKEIVLSGIRLGIYGKNEDQNKYGSLTSLIQSIAKIDNIKRIRLSSIEPMDIQLPSLLDLLENEPKLCHHLHIPLQSGDDEILIAMQRSYTRGEYLNLVNSTRSRVPDLAVTTDIIVAFPGETESQFQHTLDIVEQVRFSRVHIFRYSKRPGTAAAKLSNQVNTATIKQRVHQLTQVSSNVALHYKKSMLNKEVKVLVEGKEIGIPGYLTGLTNHYLRVLFQGDSSIINRFVTVKIDSVKENCIAGNIINLDAQ